MTKASAMHGEETKCRERALRPSSASDWVEKIHASPADCAFQDASVLQKMVGSVKGRL